MLTEDLTQTRYKARTVSSELLIENGAKRGSSLCNIKNLTQKFQIGGTDATYWTFWKGKHHGNHQFLPNYVLESGVYNSIGNRDTEVF